ncbi:MAG: phospholipid:lipid A palmitoyltransferase [Legionella sp.]|nr:MAG: phospholipid:lipid A palmitoyltransferase [Legionella sp.]PJD97140.1 MAG: phospholipid:lipid A palmitoyltransferase [Legionella sp.]
MKRLSVVFLLLLSFFAFTVQAKEYCPEGHSYFKYACQRLHQIWLEGSSDLYLSGYAWHNRMVYPPEKINKYNEQAWGGGLGKGFIDEKNNWHGLYAFAFLDSHKNVEPVAGYAFIKLFNWSQAIKPGLGYTVLVTGRPDLNKGIPFPGALPLAFFMYKKATLAATYIPGFSDNGNVLYLFAKYTL